jgi:DNA-binding NarL/FixJ family response regulator
VRNPVELSSKTSDGEAISGRAKPRLPGVADSGHTVKSGAKTDAAGLFPPFIQEACPSAPIDIDPSDVEQIARIGTAAASNMRIDGEGAAALAPIHAATDVGVPKDLVADKSDKSDIVVIHRREFFRDCFVRCLKLAYGDRTIGSYPSIAEWCGALRETSATPAAVIILIIEPGEKAGISNPEFIERTAGKIPVIIVSDADDLDHIVGALKRGARGYIPSNLSFNVVVEAVRLVEAGGVFVPASSLVDHGRPAAAPRGTVALTERQMMVLEEIRHGKANKQIAYALKMSEHTVKLHLRHIMRKLNARNRTEVAVLSETLLAAKDL